MGGGRWLRVGARLLPGVMVAALLGSISESSAEASGLPILKLITLSPSTASIVEGQTEQFTATGLLSNGTVETITNKLTWAVSSASGNFASISNTGLATGLAPGLENITATAPLGILGLLAPLTGSANLSVLPLLEAITVSPSAASIIPGQTQQFTATGLFSDGTVQTITNQLSWSSASSTLASISSTGLATGLLPGLDTITATAPAGELTGPLAGLLSPITGASNLSVLPLLEAITVSPSAASIIPGQTQQFTATGLFSDGTMQTITNQLSWSSASSTLASISSTGLATGLLPGLDTITATAPAGELTGPLAGLLSPITGASNLSVLTPSLSMTPSSGKKRTVVTTQGSNFSPGGTVVVSYLRGGKSHKTSRTQLCSATIASNGTFSCSGVIPRGGRAGKTGNHTVMAAVSGGDASTIFDLLKGTAPPA